MWRHLLTGFACLAVAAPAAAQPTDWASLVTSTRMRVIVTTDDGREVRGQVVRIEGAAIVLDVDGADQRLGAGRVVRVATPGDSVKNGALIGAGVGGTMFLLTFGLADCPVRGNPCAGDRLVMATAAIGFYALIGAGIDALTTGRTTIYAAPAPRPAPAPLAGGAGRSTGRDWRAGVVWRRSW